MAEYIERDLALRVIKQKQKELCPFGTYGKKYVDGYEREKFDEWQEIIDEIESVPAADVAEVRCGRWEEVDWVEPDGHGFGTVRTPKAGLRCNQCSNVFKKELLWKRNYCPACSAKMDLED